VGRRAAARHFKSVNKQYRVSSRHQLHKPIGKPLGIIAQLRLNVFVVFKARGTFLNCRRSIACDIRTRAGVKWM